MTTRTRRILKSGRIGDTDSTRQNRDRNLLVEIMGHEKFPMKQIEEVTVTKEDLDSALAQRTNAFLVIERCLVAVACRRHFNSRVVCGFATVSVHYQSSKIVARYSLDEDGTKLVFAFDHNLGKDISLPKTIKLTRL
jgi:hypothetical protein